MQVNSSVKIHGILWYLASLFATSINCSLMKYLGSDLPAYEIVFLRFLFSSLFFIPFIIKNHKEFKTNRLGIHLTRGGLLFLGIWLYCVSLPTTKVSVVTVISFTIPIFILILASIFLKEKLNAFKIAATAIGFIGIVIVVQPFGSGVNSMSSLLLLAAFVFACLDILNKKFVSKETLMCMMFYSGFFTLLLSALPAYNVWVVPSTKDILLCMVLGFGANIIIYLVLKAFSLVDVSTTAPYKYIELIFSSLLGYFVFAEDIDRETILGSIVVISSTMLITYETIIRSKFFKNSLRNSSKNSSKSSPEKLATD